MNRHIPINDKQIIDNIISNIIKTRKQKKLSQAKLSELCELPQATISRLESFSTEPKLSTIVKVCNALNLEIKCQQMK